VKTGNQVRWLYKGNDIPDATYFLANDGRMKADFPTTHQGAVVHFANPDNALKFLVVMRWPNGVCGPRCGSEQVSFTAKRRVWTCEGTFPERRQFSIKVGTIIEDSPITLDKGLTGIWLIVSAKNGISSSSIQRSQARSKEVSFVLGARSYRPLACGDRYIITLIKPGSIMFGPRQQPAVFLGDTAVVGVGNFQERISSARAHAVITAGATGKFAPRGWD